MIQRADPLENVLMLGMDEGKGEMGSRWWMARLHHQVYGWKSEQILADSEENSCILKSMGLQRARADLLAV